MEYAQSVPRPTPRRPSNASTRRGRGVATKNLLQAIGEGLAEEMHADETVMVLGEDVGRAGGDFRVTQGLQDEFGPSRVMDTPLAESLIVGAAIGLSVNGMRPVAEIQFADFIPPAFDRSSARPPASTTAPTGPIRARSPSASPPTASSPAGPSTTPRVPKPTSATPPASRSSPRRSPPTPRGCSRAPSATPTPSSSSNTSGRIVSSRRTCWRTTTTCRWTGLASTARGRT